MDTSTERAQLASAQAEAKLAESNLTRIRGLLAAGANTQAELDAAEARAAQANATVDSIQATIRKKTIRAPFAGRLGIRQIDLGQVLAPGTPIVSLQSLDPIYVELNLPEQHLAALEVGQTIRGTTDAFPDETWEGAIQTIDPAVNVSTRNVKIRAIIPNEQERLRPGMFFDVEVVPSNEHAVLVIPNTAVMYAPYGDSVYVVKEPESESPTVEQVFVRLGTRKGDLVAVVSGLEEGQTVVSTGAFKLQGGMAVTVQNDFAPETDANPDPENR